LPADDNGRVVHEVDAAEAAITDFFAEPDRRVAQLLESARRT
jgi:hypothetical protein